MRRLVLLGLLGLSGSSACGEIIEPPTPQPPVEDVVCPGIVPLALPSLEGSSALRSDVPADTRQPVLVRFRQPTGAMRATATRQLEEKVERLGGRVKYHWPRLAWMAARLSPEEQARLAEDPDVLSISPDRPVHALGMSPLVPVSALLAAPVAQGSISEYTSGLNLVQAPQVWDADGDGVLDIGAPTGAGIKVCIIDSGIDDRHPELQVPYLAGKDFVDDDDDPKDQSADGKWGGGHGTHVAGTVAAQLGSGGVVDPQDSRMSPGGVVGVAPGAQLLVARVLNEKGNGDTSDVIAALQWCQEQGANIASLSLGSSADSAAEKEAFAQAWQAGMLSIAASGNGGSPDTETGEQAPVYPAAYPDVVAVGSVRDDEIHSVFSQTGQHLSLVAPGEAVLSSYIVGASPYADLDVGGSFYNSRVLDFTPFGDYSGPLVDCGLGDDRRSCKEGATCEGFVAFVQRGGITFADKVANVWAQGARAVIIGNHDPEQDADLPFTLGSDKPWPPTTAVPTTSVQAIRAQVGATATVGIRGYDYAFNTGTSMATPHVSGVAALVWSARPQLTNEQVRDILQRSAKDLEFPGVTSTGRDKFFGYGLVQAKRAVDLAIQENP